MAGLNTLFLQPVAAAAGLWLVYCIFQSIYRLYFSPISEFPGPKVAALSFWYEFYYDVVLGGKYIFQIQDLHRIYGPVVRINPYELHFSDPNFIDEVYAGGNRKRDKWEWFTRQAGLDSATVVTNAHELHRIRRGALNPFFSKASVRSLQPILDRSVALLLERLEGSKGTDEVITLNYVFAAFGNDVVTEYAFGLSANRLAKKDFDKDFHDLIVSGSTGGMLAKHWNWVLILVQMLPESIAMELIPIYKWQVLQKREVQGLVERVMKAPETTLSDLGHRTIFHDLLDSKLPAQEKTLLRLSDDALITVVAGTLTTAWTLCIAVFFLLSDPAVLEKLKSELTTAMPNASAYVALADLEALPYLTAVIEESLRLSYGCIGRLSRIPTEEDLSYDDGKKTWVIPRGTPCSISAYIIHHDETIFPDSFSFRPERWLEDPRLDRYLMAFSRGSRNCLGMNLAYGEMYMQLAALFRRYGSTSYRAPDDEGILELFETNRRDTEAASDFITPLPPPDSKGIRIRVKK